MTIKYFIQLYLMRTLILYKICISSLQLLLTIHLFFTECKHCAFLIQNWDTLRLCTYIHAYFRSPLSLVFLFHSLEDAKESEALGYTCIAIGASLRSSIINVHRVSQVEAPKSIYPRFTWGSSASCEAQLCVLARTFVRMRARLWNIDNNAVELSSDGILSIKTDLASRNEDRSILSSFARWLTNAMEEGR